MKPPKMVEVFWVDSAFHRGWSSHETKRKEMQAAGCRTLGYLVDDAGDCIKVAHSVDAENESFADAIAIPRVAVQKIRKVK